MIFSRTLARLALVLLLSPLGAGAQEPSTTWSVQQSILRDDNLVVWTAPEAIDTTLSQFDFTYEITSIEIYYGGIVTADEEIDRYAAANQLTGAGVLTGLPGELWSQTLAEPFSDTQFELDVTVGSDGIGRATFSDIQLGTVPVNFGTSRIPINALTLEATITLVGSDVLLGDYSGNGIVNQTDYLIWTEAYGTVSANADADGNRDGVVNAADYTIWRDNLPAAAAAIPEPTSLATMLLGLASFLGRRRFA